MRGMRERERGGEREEAERRDSEERGEPMEERRERERCGQDEGAIPACMPEVTSSRSPVVCFSLRRL